MNSRYTAVESYRKHIGYLRRTGPRKARAGRKSGRPPVPVFYWHATHRPVQYTPHQKRRSDTRSISFRITDTASISTRRPGSSDDCPHLAWQLQNASNTGKDSDKHAPRTGGHAGIRHSTATQPVTYKSPKKKRAAPFGAARRRIAL